MKDKLITLLMIGFVLMCIGSCVMKEQKNYPQPDEKPAEMRKLKA